MCLAQLQELVFWADGSSVPRMLTVVNQLNMQLLNLMFVCNNYCACRPITTCSHSPDLITVWLLLATFSLLLCACMQAHTQGSDVERLRAAGIPVALDADQYHSKR